MSGNIELLFPTPIYYDVLDDTTISCINQEIQTAVDNISWTTPDGWGKTHDLSTSEFVSDDIDTYRLNKFSSVLNEHLEKYCQYLQFPIKNYSRTSWFSRFKFGDYGRTHSHHHADISGCYYFKTSGNDGDIYFATPAACAETSLCYRKFIPFWRHKPLVGKILLFPGWLEHGIMTNETEKERISLSFNIFFDR